MISTWYENILSGMVAIAVALIGGWFVILGFAGAKVSMSHAKFPVRTTSIVYKQLLPNKPTNDFLPVTIFRWY